MRALRWIGAAGLVCGCACTQAPPETPEPIFFADVESISLGYETRHAIAVAAASSRTYRVHVPTNGSLRFAIATAEPDEAVMFRALVDGNPVFEKTLAKEDGDHWWDQPRVDLEPWAGESVDVTFETDGRALWGSPVIETEDAEEEIQNRGRRREPVGRPKRPRIQRDAGRAVGRPGGR